MTKLVRDVMTDNVVAVRREAAYKEIIEVMRRRQVSAFPVLDSDNRVIGVVAESDLLAKEAYQARPGRLAKRGGVSAKAAALTAGDLMNQPAITITADATVTDAARLMHRCGVRRLPVVDTERRLVGVVSRVDLLGVYDRTDADIAAEVMERVIAGDFVLKPADFEVTVDNGIVTVDGSVERPSVARRLTDAIRDVDGVVDVRDRLSSP